MEDKLQWRQPSMGEDLCDGRQLLMEDDLRWRTPFDGGRPSMENNRQWKMTLIGEISRFRSAIYRRCGRFSLWCGSGMKPILARKLSLATRKKPWPPKISGFHPLPPKKRKFVRTPPKKRDPHSWRGQHGMVKGNMVNRVYHIHRQTKPNQST